MLEEIEKYFKNDRSVQIVVDGSHQDGRKRKQVKFERRKKNGRSRWKEIKNNDNSKSD